MSASAKKSVCFRRSGKGNYMTKQNTISFNDFLKKTDGKILICDKESDGISWLKTESLYKNAFSFNCTVYTLEKIAEEIVTAYSIIHHYEIPEILNSENSLMEPEFIHSFFAQYGIDPTVFLDYAGLKEIQRTVNAVRLSVKDVNGPLSNTARMVIDISKEYEKQLQHDNRIDQIGVLKKAVDILKEYPEEALLLFPGASHKIIGVAKVKVCTSLENEMIETMSQAFKENSFYYLINLIPNASFNESSESGVKWHLISSYGKSNLSEGVADIICKNYSHNLNDISVWLVSQDYIPYMAGYFEDKNIAYVIKDCYPAEASSFVQCAIDLLQAYINDFDAEYLKKILTNKLVNPKKNFINYLNSKSPDLSQAVDFHQNSAIREVVGLGWGKERIEYFCQENAIKNAQNTFTTQNVLAWFLNSIIEIFDGSWTSPESLYKKIYQWLLENTVEEQSDKTDLSQSIADSRGFMKNQICVIQRVYGRSAKTMKESAGILLNHIKNSRMTRHFGKDAEEKGVEIQLWTGLVIPERRDNFFIGFSASEMDSQISESPLLRDKEMKQLFSSKEDQQFSAEFRNQQRKKDFKDTLLFVKQGESWIGYAKYDTVNLYELSPSLLLYELGEELKGKQSFNDWLKKSSDLGYKQILPKNHIFMNEHAFYPAIQKLVNKSIHTINKGAESKPVYFSATLLQRLFECPLNYYYKQIWNLDGMQPSNREFSKWLNAREKGLFFHELAEKYVKEAFPPKASVDKGFDEALFNQCFEEVKKNIEKKVPVPNKDLKEMEIYELKADCKTFFKQMHDVWQLNKEEEWEVLGCELSLKGLNLKVNISNNSDSILINSGFIDRLDVRIDSDDIMHLRIIDYKTGKKENFKNTFKRGWEVQDLIYSLGALNYVKNILTDKDSEMQEMSWNGRKIKGFEIPEAEYIFPFDKESDKTYTALRVGENLTRPTIGQCLTEDAEKNWNLSFKQKVKENANGEPIDGNTYLNDVLHDYITTGQFNMKNIMKYVWEENNSPCEYCDYQKVCRANLTLDE